MFEPRIVAFLCSWCSYTGADTAGIARLKIPANLLAVRVPCSGRVSPELVMRAFDEGADGVLVLGCHIGECHYDNGNHRTAKRLPILTVLLTFAGLEPERLRLDWVSASEGERFARITNEFTEKVRELGPAQWRISPDSARKLASVELKPTEATPLPEEDFTVRTEAIRSKARELLANNQVSCVIGYEVDRRGKTRPAFIHSAEEATKLVWNTHCRQNLAHYLPGMIGGKKPGDANRVALLVKPCDSRAINVLVAENAIRREALYAIGVTCGGMEAKAGGMEERCIGCRESAPAAADVLIGEHAVEHQPGNSSAISNAIAALDGASPVERMEFWLSQFDRCIRCYACRQACPLCNCPTCLYERDDSLYLGPAIRLNEKRAFHLGRAFHLAGRCIGCNECERACPVGIPLSLLNQKLTEEVERAFGYRAGSTVSPSPIVTVLEGEYKEG